uniref:Uncharacterized protein n=1 Tax=Rhizophora mucronata TaxID=61149 RepID=A0A2P2LA11_RHIMU
MDREFGVNNPICTLLLLFIYMLSFGVWNHLSFQLITPPINPPKSHLSLSLSLSQQFNSLLHYNLS